jgi:FkbM family methyltransferase
MVRMSIQNIIIWTTRPYISRERLGWGKLFEFVGGWRRDWLWATAPVRTIRGKVHGYLMHLNLTEWPDRSTYFLERWYDLEAHLLMKTFIRPGDTVIDVGANRGMFALTACHLTGENGKVICFEPNPNCIKTLRLEIETNNIRNIMIHQCALGERDADMTLSVPKYNSGEGTLAKNLFRSNTTYEVSIQVKTGDDLLKGENPSFIKMDVEGYEVGVLKGLRNTIRSHRPVIITEVNPTYLAACGSSFRELCELMSSLGYCGYKSGLKKVNNKYTSYLTALSEENCDAVWFHESEHKARVAELNDR